MSPWDDIFTEQLAMTFLYSNSTLPPRDLTRFPRVCEREAMYPRPRTPALWILAHRRRPSSTMDPVDAERRKAYAAMSPAERRAYLGEVGQKRKAIQAQIQQFSAARDKHVRAERARLAAEAPAEAAAAAAPLAEAIEAAIDAQMGDQ